LCFFCNPVLLSPKYILLMMKQLCYTLFVILCLQQPAFAQTILNRGDLAVLGVNSNISSVSGNVYNTKDEISFVCFKNITTGTKIQILDAGYQNCVANFWSCGQEGGAEFTRTGGTIPAGTVITFRTITTGTGYQFLSPDNAWSVTDLFVHPSNTNYSVLSADFNINAGGDQLYFAQGGVWTEQSTLCTINGNRTSPNASFPGNNGRILFGFSTSGAWNSFQQSSGESGLYPGMECFSMAPTNTPYSKYSGPITPATQTTWITRISNPSNWTTYTQSNYSTSGYDFAGGYTLSILAGGGIPTATWTPPSSSLCSNAASINLNTLITGTTGGTWSGTGVSGNTFNPTGLNGSYNITYSVNYTSNGNTCPITQTSTITVVQIPAAPTVTSTISYCQNASATALTATGTNLLWYTVATGGTGSSTAPIPSTTTVGSTTFYVSQSTSGCEGPRASIQVNITAAPAAPTVTSPIGYCQNATATALTATGTNLLWYTAASGGTGSSTAPTPNTSTVGSITYYVSQTIGGCESPRASIQVNIGTVPAAPTVTSPIIYCQNASAAALTATGTNLLWYTAASGGTGSSTAPTPNTSTVGSTIYYVSQTTSGCESPRASITVTVSSSIIANAISNQTVCANTPTSAISFTGTGNAVYNWTNNNTSIGLAASGTGNIPSFSALNSTTSPVTATITASPVAFGYAYIPNFGSVATPGSTVSIINTFTNTVVGSVSVGINPFGVAVSPDGSRVYITNYSPLSSSVSVINTATNTVIATIPVGIQPMGVCVSPDGTRVYVANQLGNSVSVINTVTNTVIATVPVSLQPQGICISPDGSKVYVANVNSNNVSIINTANNTVIGVVIVGTQPITVALNPDGSRLYVPNFGTNNVSVINTSTNTVVATIVAGTNPNGAAVSPDGTKLYITNQSSANVTIINPATNTVTATVGVGLAPQGVSFTSNSATAYVANFLSNNVSVINTATNAVTATVTVGLVPHALGNFITPIPCNGQSILFTITVNPAVPTPISVSRQQPTCTQATGTITVTAPIGTGYSYSIDGTNFQTSNIFPNLLPNTYTVTIKNSYDCINSLTGLVINTAPSAPVAPTVTSPITYCQNASATALTATGTNLLWYTSATGGTGSSSAPTPSTTTVGSTTYYVSQSSNGCESPRVAIQVNVTLTPAAPVAASSIAYCQNTTATALTATGTNLLWYTSATGGTGSSTAPTPNTSIVGSTTYYVSQNNGGCESPRTSIQVNVTSVPNAPAVNSPIGYCQNATATALTATGSNLLWYTSATGGTASTIAPTPSTLNVGSITYYVSQSNGNCESPRAAIQVNVTSTPVPPTVTSPVSYCQNTTATALTATGTNLLWYTSATGGTGSTIPSTPSTINVGSTTYYVSQTNGNCESSRISIQVDVITAPTQPTISSFTGNELCEGQSTILNSSASSGNQWLLNGTAIAGATNSFITINQGGNYSVQATNAGGCSATSTDFTVTVYPNPIVSAGPDVLLYENDSIRLQGSAIGGNTFTYAWLPLIYLSNDTIANPWVVQPKADTYYLFAAINEHGCFNTDGVWVRVLKDLKIPNAFSPNGDGVNDKWEIDNLSAYSNAIVEVFARSGQVVYKSIGYSRPWDGTYNGKPVPSGVYYYVIQLRTSGSIKQQIRSGSVTLLR
jgi:gliding motility-associated-like protein